MKNNKPHKIGWRIELIIANIINLTKNTKELPSLQESDDSHV